MKDLTSCISSLSKYIYFDLGLIDFQRINGIMEWNVRMTLGKEGKVMLPEKQSDKRGRSSRGLMARKRNLGRTCPKGSSN